MIPITAHKMPDNTAVLCLYVKVSYTTYIIPQTICINTKQAPNNSNDVNASYVYRIRK